LICSRSLSRLLALASAAVVLAPGCNSESTGHSRVQGSVRFAGQRVETGGIAFIPQGNTEGAPRCRRATGEIHNGSYDLDHQRGPDPGQYRVEITWKKKTGRKIPSEGKRLMDETEQVIPSKYNTESELFVEVKPGRNTFHFDLEN